MTAQTENSNLEMKLSDLQKKFGEEKMAHGQTILQLLSAQDQAQTAEAEAAKAQELVAVFKLKLDQACGEIKRLRVLTRGGQVQAQEAQGKIESLEDQMAQMRLSEQSQAQTAIEAQAQELKAAQAKIASLEAVVAKARAVFAESELTTNPDHTAQDQAQELKAAQAKIERLEVQMAQAEELKAALAKITELEAQMAQSEKQAQEENLLLNYENRDLRAQTRKLHEHHANYEKAQNQELEAAQAQVAQAQEEVRSLKEAFGAQTQELQDAQNKLLFLEAARSKPKAPVRVPIRTEWSEPPTWLENSGYLDIDNLTECPAQWFGPQHLHYFSGSRLELGKSSLRTEDMAQFLDSWLSGSHPYLETIILNDFQPQPMFFDRFASSLVREYGDNPWNHTMTYHFERPSDGRIACVKINRHSFIFIV